MCGRYAATLPPEMMVELFKLLNSVDVPARWNITPTEPIVAVWQDDIGWGWWWAVPVGGSFVLAILGFRLLVQRAQEAERREDEADA